MNLYQLFTIDNMIDAYYSCRQAAPWKTEVQKFGLNLIGNCIALQNEILTGTYRTSKPRQFTISERGKLRVIEAPVFRDRMVGYTEKELYHTILAITNINRGDNL